MKAYICDARKLLMRGDRPEAGGGSRRVNVVQNKILSRLADNKQERNKPTNISDHEITGNGKGAKVVVCKCIKRVKSGYAKQGIRKSPSAQNNFKYRNG